MAGSGFVRKVGDDVAGCSSNTVASLEDTAGVVAGGLVCETVAGLEDCPAESGAIVGVVNRGSVCEATFGVCSVGLKGVATTDDWLACGFSAGLVDTAGVPDGCLTCGTTTAPDDWLICAFSTGLVDTAGVLDACLVGGTTAATDDWLVCAFSTGLADTAGVLDACLVGGTTAATDGWFVSKSSAGLENCPAGLNGWVPGEGPDGGPPGLEDTATILDGRLACEAAESDGCAVAVLDG
jgi:hypothetical protein